MKWRGTVDSLVQGELICPLCIMHHYDRPFNSWIQNSSSNTLTVPVWWECLILLKPTFELLQSYYSQMCLTGKLGNYDKWFSMVFHTKSPAYGWFNRFSSLTFNFWQRGRISEKEDTNIFRGAFSPIVLFISTLCERRRSSQRSCQYLSSWLEGLVRLWSLPWETHSDRDVSLWRRWI